MKIEVHIGMGFQNGNNYKNMDYQLKCKMGEKWKRIGREMYDKWKENALQSMDTNGTLNQSSEEMDHHMEC